MIAENCFKVQGLLHWKAGLESAMIEARSDNIYYVSSECNKRYMNLWFAKLLRLLNMDLRTQFATGVHFLSSQKIDDSSFNYNQECLEHALVPVTDVSVSKDLPIDKTDETLNCFPSQ